MYSQNVGSASLSQKDDESMKKTMAEMKSIEPKKRVRPAYELNAVQLERKRECDRNAQRVKKQQTHDHIASLMKKIEELPDNSEICSQISKEEERTAKLEEELRQLRREVAEKFRGPSVREVFDPVRDSASDVDASRCESRDYLENPKPTSSTPAACLADDTSMRTSHTVTTTTTTTTVTTTSETTTTSTRKPRNSFKSTNRVLSSRVKSLPTPRRAVQAQLVKQPQIHLWELPLCATEVTETTLGNILASILKRSNDTPRIPGKPNFREPKYPTFNIYGDREQFNALYPIAGVLSDIFPRMSHMNLIEHVGVMVYTYLIYRWQVARDYETYTDLPSHLQPILVQRTTPSSAWVCCNAFPGLRKAVITVPEKYANEEFLAQVAGSLNVNWPHTIEDALVRTRYGFTIRKAFWDHIMDLENWSMDEPFQKAYPELEGSCNFTK